MKRVAVLSFALIVGCSEPYTAPSTMVPAEPTTPTPPVVAPSPLAGRIYLSNPIIRGAGAATQSVVYVSLLSGRVNPTDVVVISNLRTNVSLPLTIAGFGFDPAGIPATVDDIIDVALTPNGTGPTTHTQVTVAAGRPLLVIRTDPVNTADAVGIDASVSAVFSEPLDVVQSAGRIRLRHGSADVAATLTLDSTGTQATLRPSDPFAAGDGYRLDIDSAATGISGAKLLGSTSASFTTAPRGTDAAASLVAGEWDATSWRFTDLSARGAYSDDPVVGWGPNAYYRIHLTVSAATSGPPGSVNWRMKMTWVLGGPPDSAIIVGSATVGASSWLGRTTASPWLAFTSSCEYGWLCPLQDFHDFARDGNTLALTRRRVLLYNDGFDLWPASETLTLRRATP